MEEVLESNLTTPEQSNKVLAMPEDVFDWKKHYLKEGHSVASAITYFNYIKGYVGYGIEINQKTVNTFRNKSPLGASAGALKNFFNFLVKKKDFKPEILYIYFDKSKSTKKFPESLEPIEVERIINAMVELKDKYFTIVLSTLGLRIGEGLKLKFEDFNWITWLQDRTKQGSVNLKNTKGGKYRTIPVPKEVMEMLYSNAVNPNKSSDGIPIGNLVFNYGIERFISNKEQSNDENLYTYLKYAGDRYRIILTRVSKDCLGKPAHPHCFRHYQAQSLLNRGLSLDSLKSFLGHSSISSTEIYASSSSEKLKRDMENLPS